MSVNTSQELRQIYSASFQVNLEYRRKVWAVLVNEFFGRYIRPQNTVLDLGCGYGEFINQIRCARRLAMDLNPDAPSRLDQGVECILQDCSATWPLPDESLDLVFASNFFEHLPDKPALASTLAQAYRCLKKGGRLIAMGPNIKFLTGAY